MNGILINIKTLYLAIMLIIIWEGLKSFNFIKKELIIWIILIMSILINVIFNGIKLNVVLNGIIAASLATLIHNLIFKTMKILNQRK